MLRTTFLAIFNPPEKIEFPMHPQVLPHPDTVVATRHALPTTRLQLALPLDFEYLESLRGAIAAQAGLHNELFHNHDNSREGYHYRYPLIQYHCTDGKAAMLGLGEGGGGACGMGTNLPGPPPHEWQAAPRTHRGVPQRHGGD